MTVDTALLRRLAEVAYSAEHRPSPCTICELADLAHEAADEQPVAARTTASGAGVTVAQAWVVIPSCSGLPFRVSFRGPSRSADSETPTHSNASTSLHRSLLDRSFYSLAPRKRVPTYFRQAVRCKPEGGPGATPVPSLFLVAGATGAAHLHPHGRHGYTPAPIHSPDRTAAQGEAVPVRQPARRSTRLCCVWCGHQVGGVPMPYRPTVRTLGDHSMPARKVRVHRPAS